MRKRKCDMEVRDIRQDLMPAFLHPLLLLQIAAAGAVAVAAGTGMHFRMAAVRTLGDSIAKLSGLACHQGPHDLQLPFRDLVQGAVVRKVHLQEITDRVLLFGSGDGTGFPDALRILRRKFRYSALYAGQVITRGMRDRQVGSQWLSFP